jgi:hypothetical protein
VWDQERAFAAIGEAVWYITMVDATLVRHHPLVYNTVIASHTPAGRRLIAETLAGLRFARPWISRGAPLGEAIEPAQAPGVLLSPARVRLTWHVGVKEHPTG